MTREESIQIVALLATGTKGKDLSEDEIAMFASMIQDVDFEVGKTVAAQLIQTETWMPSVAEFRAAARQATNGGRKTGTELWGDVLDAIARNGYTREPDWSDPLIGQAIRSVFGSWKRLCESPLDQEMSDRARFAQAYDSLAERAARHDVLSPEVAEALESSRQRELTR